MAIGMKLMWVQGGLLHNLRFNGSVGVGRKLCMLDCRLQSTCTRWELKASAAVQPSFSSVEAEVSVSPAPEVQEGRAGVPLLEALNSKQVEQVNKFVDILLKYNSEKFNLTAVTERSEVMERHVEDSLALLPVIEAACRHDLVNSSSGQLKVVDVGTGAGLPGVILAIARPEWQITLLDSTLKRCKFMKDAAEHSGVGNIAIVNSRAEDAGQNEIYRERFDVAVARALAEMRVLAELCLPLVRVGGFLIAAKGANPQNEVDGAQKAVSMLGGGILSVTTVQSVGPLGPRTAVVCSKEQSTPPKYPRRAGTPQKKPL